MYYRNNVETNTNANININTWIWLNRIANCNPHSFDIFETNYYFMRYVTLQVM